jgi:hypothetical protein
MELVQDRRMYWGNFATGGHDYRGLPETDEECTQYIPQHDAAQSLYKLCREDWAGGNLTPLQAMTRVLMAVAGTHE